MFADASPVFRRAVSKLVAFVEQARVGRIYLERPVVSGASLSRLLADVKVADAEIAPDDEVWIQLALRSQS